jgi:hypothetical protein
VTSISLSQDAMTVLGLAGTALMFAESVEDEVERWLRPLRLYGKAGAALQALGVGEGQIDTAPNGETRALTATPQQTLHSVTDTASRLAAERGAASVGTLDILLAVMRHYGDAFDQALRRHGSDSDELLARLAGDAVPAAGTPAA